MVPNIETGKGITGAVRYVMQPKKDDPSQTSRTAWIGGQGFEFPIDDADDVEVARRIMEYMSFNQTSKTKKCVKDCWHTSLSWNPGERPTPAEMDAAGREALASVGMGTAAAIFVEQTDKPFVHIHIVASRIRPDGKTYDNTDEKKKIQAWALEYEERRGEVFCKKRLETRAAAEKVIKASTPYQRKASAEWRKLRALAPLFKGEKADNRHRQKLRRDKDGRTLDAVRDEELKSSSAALWESQLRQRKILHERHRQQSAALTQHRQPVSRAAWLKDRQRERNLIIRVWRTLKGLRGRCAKAANAETARIRAALKAMQAAEMAALMAMQGHVRAENRKTIKAAHKALRTQYLADLERLQHIERVQLVKWHERDFAAQLRTARYVSEIENVLAPSALVHMQAVPSAFTRPTDGEIIGQTLQAAPTANTNQPHEANQDGKPSAGEMATRQAVAAKMSANNPEPPRQANYTKPKIGPRR